MNNRDLYESEEVLKKYGENNTRVRSLNNAEKAFIDRFAVKDKKVLVVGSGAGRVPANLLLFGNAVSAADRSRGMVELARKNFPSSIFPTLAFRQAEAEDLSAFPDDSFDVVFFPQNGIDYIETIEGRERALSEMARKVKSGGILAFSSHNKAGYLFSPRIPFRHHSFASWFRPYGFVPEHVVGGGRIFKGNPEYVIRRTGAVTGMRCIGYTCDIRSRISSFLSKNLHLAKYFFPYILYIFKKA